MQNMSQSVGRLAHGSTAAGARWGSPSALLLCGDGTERLDSWVCLQSARSTGSVLVRLAWNLALVATDGTADKMKL